MTNKLTDTQQIDLLFQKISEVEETVENKLKRMKPLKTMGFFDPFIEYKNKGYIDIPRIYKTKTCFSDYRHMLTLFMMNKEKTFDEELFLMLKITVKFNHSFTSRASGLYTGNKIIINRAWAEALSMYGTSVMRHEVGHAWHIQFSKMLGIDEWEMSKYFLRHYLKQLGIEIKSSKFYSYKPYIERHISKYGTKNYLECFAELFELATQNEESAKDNLVKWEYAKNSLLSLNNWIKVTLWNNC